MTPRLDEFVTAMEEPLRMAVEARGKRDKINR